MIRVAITAAIFLLPPCRLKNGLLSLLGHSVGRGVRIMPSLVLGVERFRLADGAYIGPGNVFRNMRLVELGERAIIGQWNWISSSAPLSQRGAGHAELHMARESSMVSRHVVDCTGGVTVDEFAVIGGLRSVLLTHQVDFRTNELMTAPIHIGAYSLVNACNKLVPGAVVPARCVTGMNSVITTGLHRPGRLYAGVPARDLKPVEGGWFNRSDGFLVA